MNLEAVAKQLAAQVKTALAERDETIASLIERVKTLEARPDPKDGKDGRDGVDGKDAPATDLKEVYEIIAGRTEAIKNMQERLADIEGRPAPRDGRDGQPGQKGDPGDKGYDGRDGQDGWSPDHVEFVVQDDGTGEFRMVTGEKEKRFPFRLPVLVDTGPYKQESSYLKGQGVTYGGDYWICKEDNPGPPGKDFAGWRLAVRKGRDARGAKV